MGFNPPTHALKLGVGWGAGPAYGGGGGGGGGGGDKITCSPESAITFPLTLYGNLNLLVSSMADLGAALGRPGKIVSKK